MGLKYNALTSQLFTQGIRTNVQQAYEILDVATRGSEQVVNSIGAGTSLDSVSYNAGKGLFSEVINPAEAQFKRVVEDIQNDLNAYLSAENSVIGYGNLDEDDLNQQISFKQTKKQHLEEMQRLYNDLSGGMIAPPGLDYATLQQAINEIDRQIYDLQKQVKALQEFQQNTQNLFRDSLDAQAQIVQGISALSQIITDSSGNYFLNGASMKWLSNLKGEEYSSDLYNDKSSKSYKERMKSDLAKYNVYAVPYYAGGEQKINWVIEDKKTHFEVNDKELLDYLKKYGTSLGGDLVQLLSGDEYGKHVESALNRGYDYKTGKKLNPLLWGVREGLFKLGDGMEFMDDNQIAKNLSQLGFAFGVYKLEGGQGIKLLLPDKTGSFKISKLPTLKNTDDFRANAIPHSLAGELNKNGDAAGYHSRVIAGSNAEIKVVSPPDKYGVYKANVKINGVPKKALSSMFPDTWSAQKIIDEVNYANKNKYLDEANKYIGKASNGMKIEVVIKKGKIDDFWPIYKGGK